jgi:hypothetical protein
MTDERQEPLYRYLKDIGLVVPNARSEIVRARIAEAVARLDPAAESEALDWIEAVSEFDDGNPTQSKSPFEGV